MLNDKRKLTNTWSFFRLVSSRACSRKVLGNLPSEAMMTNKHKLVKLVLLARWHPLKPAAEGTYEML